MVSSPKSPMSHPEKEPSGRAESVVNRLEADSASVPAPEKAPLSSTPMAASKGGAQEPLGEPASAPAALSPQGDRSTPPLAAPMALPLRAGSAGETSKKVSGASLRPKKRTTALGGKRATRSAPVSRTSRPAQGTSTASTAPLSVKTSAAKKTTATKATTGKAKVKAAAAPKKNKTTQSATSRKAASSRGVAKANSGKAQTSSGAPVGDVFALGRANVDAVLESGVTVFMGVQDFQAQCWDFACESLGQSVEAGASLLKCTSPKDVIEMQQSLIQDGLERWVQTTQDLSKISNVTALDALSPLNRDIHGGETAGARHKPTTPSRRL